MKVNVVSVALCVWLAAVLLSACGGSSSGGTNPPPGNPEPEPPDNPEPAQIHIDTNVMHQKVAGFGGALPMWTVVTTALTDDEIRKLVGTNDDELGLTILRTIIDPHPEFWHRAAASLREAKLYSDSVRILASPWSPPAHMKSNNSVINGGRLLEEYYGDYADHLNAYIDYMASQDVVIDVVSIQNEPDYAPSYESAEWTGEEMRNFVRDYGDRIQAEVMIGESLRFDRQYSDPSLNDEQALENFEYIGGHLYSAESSGTFAPYPLAEEKGKELWMTEWNYHVADGDGAPIWGGENLDVWNETLDVVLASVHKTMDVNWSAYIWWWSLRFYSFLGDGQSEFGTTRGEILKRGWAFSHYSKFVRPGYQRVGATAGGMESVYVTAYSGEDDIIVMVALNRSENVYEDVALNLPTSISEVDAYITSQTQNREPLAVSVDSDQASLPTLPARSVVSVVVYP